jgi:fructose-1,6-bisphosphatase/inositol monophosphatase family enzyme
MIYDPMLDDWWEAALGEGAVARLRGRSRTLRLAPGAERLGDAVAIVHHNQYPPEARARLLATFPRLRHTGSLRASAHEWHLLAEGSADLCLNAGLCPWDHAAGALLYREAGGVARLLTGEDYAPRARRGRLLAARSERLWEAAAEMWEGIE